MSAVEIPGYDYGKAAVALSPLTMDELRRLEETVGWTDEDARRLQYAAVVIVPQADQMVDGWRSSISRQPHLSAAFFTPQGTPDEKYKSAVKKRFVQWISDLCLRPHDREWLDYQEEIGLRHTPAKKNATDRSEGTPVVPLRYLIAFAPVVTSSFRSYLGPLNATAAELQAIEDAWTKAVLLSIALWSRPYAPSGLW